MSQSRQTLRQLIEIFILTHVTLLLSHEQYLPSRTLPVQEAKKEITPYYRKNKYIKQLFTRNIQLVTLLEETIV